MCQGGRCLLLHHGIPETDVALVPDGGRQRVGVADDDRVRAAGGGCDVGRLPAADPSEVRRPPLMVETVDDRELAAVLRD
jgi:hypothetical protein